MSILIRGMELPPYCDPDCPGIRFRVCPIKELGEALMYRYEETRHPDCPIVEVPPHGRLIDADAFVKQRREWYCENCKRRKNSNGRFVYEIGGVPCRACDIGDMIDAVDDAQTIIPAKPCNDLAKPNNDGVET